MINPAHQGYKGVQNGNVDGLAQKGSVLLQIASENGHGACTNA